MKTTSEVMHKVRNSWNIIRLATVYLHQNMAVKIVLSFYLCCPAQNKPFWCISTFPLVIYLHFIQYIWYTLKHAHNSKPRSHHINTLLHSLGKADEAALWDVSHAIKMHCFTAWLHFEGAWESFTVLRSSGFLTRVIISELRHFQALRVGIILISLKRTGTLCLTLMGPCCNTILMKEPLNSHAERPLRPTRSFQDALAFSPAASTSLEPGHISRVQCFR